MSRCKIVLKNGRSFKTDVPIKNFYDQLTEDSGFISFYQSNKKVALVPVSEILYINEIKRSDIGEEQEVK